MQGQSLMRGQPGNSFSRFERIALVLSSSQALGAYQAGACAALETRGVRPNWVAGSGIGAVNAAIIAGNLPHQRIPKLRRFWHKIGECTRSSPGLGQWGLHMLGCGHILLRSLRGRWSRLSSSAIAAAQLCELINEAVDFARVNSGNVRFVLGAVNLATGAETFFDNDRHVLTVDHVLAGAPMQGLPPVLIDNQLFGGSTALVSALDEARRADTLCFAIDGYDPLPASAGAISRSARDIAALRRTHDLRRMIALLGARLPLGLRGEADIRHCLAEASNALMTILHLVHEDSAVDLTAKLADYSPAAVRSRWAAGESDIAAILAHPHWLAPPSRLAGVVVREVRGGIVGPQH